MERSPDIPAERLNSPAPPGNPDSTPFHRSQTHSLPTVPLGDKQVSRLIVGGNPFKANSHFSADMNKEMLKYFTISRIKQTLFDCERHGINTMQLRGDAHMLACVREYWDDGGTMQFIAQTASELRDLPGHVKSLAGFGPIAIYIHGTWTDRHYLGGDMTDVLELAKAIRGTGLPVGLGTHIPQVIEDSEEKGWDVDFYMACLYNLSVKNRDSSVVTGKFDDAEQFWHEDRFRMLKTIRETPKTCLAFKILGASRLCDSSEELRDAFLTAYQGIKPKDACVVGMFPKHKDQVRENTRLVREILSEPPQPS